MNNNSVRTVIPFWAIIAAVVIGVVLFAGTIMILNFSRPPRVPVGVVTAALTVIPAPTATIPAPSPTEIITSENNVPPPPGSGEIILGEFVEVDGTEGAGLRLRSGPGLDNEALFLGLEDEVFKVEDGPQEADGYIWWYLVAPFNAEQSGWAVSNYLTPIQNP